VIAPDLRGFGDSSKPSSGYDTRSITEDVVQLVRQLGLGRVFVVGHDMGAVHAYTYANQYPDEVRGIAYLEEPLPGFGYEQLAQLKPIRPCSRLLLRPTSTSCPDHAGATRGRTRALKPEFLDRRMSYDPAASLATLWTSSRARAGGTGIPRQHRRLPRDRGETIRQNRGVGAHEAAAP
jgi:pimeloyl-ACP methyl ester carboxylesterase